MSRIKLKGLMEENLHDYKKASLFLAFPSCDWKCLKECGLDISICQNSELSKESTTEYELNYIWRLYKKNILTESFVLGGLEPLKSFDSVMLFVKFIREENECEHDIVIYTGYYPHECSLEIDKLSKYKNIIMKFGRFKPNSNQIFDEILGINLNSDNQFARKIGG